MVYETGDRVFIIESSRIIRGAAVVKRSGEFYTLRFDDGGGIKLRGSRLYATEEEAQSAIPKSEIKERKTGYRSPYDYGN